MLYRTSYLHFELQANSAMTTTGQVPGSQPPNFMLNLPTAKPLVPKKHPITNDYTILTRCLGVGVNGKVLECIHKATGDRRALKVSDCIAVCCACHCVEVGSGGPQLEVDPPPPNSLGTFAFCKFCLSRHV